MSKRMHINHFEEMIHKLEVEESRFLTNSEKKLLLNFYHKGYLKGAQNFANKLVDEYSK